MQEYEYGQFSLKEKRILKKEIASSKKHQQSCAKAKRKRKKKRK